MEIAMDHGLLHGPALEARLLSACRQAVVAGRGQVAEHLRYALGQLSRHASGAKAAVEQACLFLAERGCQQPMQH